MAAARQPDWQALARAGWKLAAEAAVETGAAVFADLGPAPDTEAAPAGSIYTAVARCFVEQGAKNFLFETLSSDAGVLEAVQAVKAQVPDAFVLVSFAVLPDGYTREGMYSKDLVRRMTESGIVDAVGFNCVSAPGAMRTLVQQLGSTALPLSVMPNAGYPVVTRHPGKVSGKAGILRQRAGPNCGGRGSDPGRLLRHHSGSHCRPAGSAGFSACCGKSGPGGAGFHPGSTDGGKR